jgi:aarF domain-containing kinase
MSSECRQIELVDFGATREYSKEFMDKWLRLLQAATAGNREACAEWSIKLGYLTGAENEVRIALFIEHGMINSLLVSHRQCLMHT